MMRNFTLSLSNWLKGCDWIDRLQATPRKPKKAPAAELPGIFSSFKNPFAGPFTFGVNDPNASTGEVQKPFCNLLSHRSLFNPLLLLVPEN